MEQSDGLMSVAVYLAILALAVAWFLLPRWLKRRKAGQIEKAGRAADHPKPVPGSDLR
jgi:predicted MFS family arabinose efflux permease